MEQFGFVNYIGQIVKLSGCLFKRKIIPTNGWRKSLTYFRSQAMMLYLNGFKFMLKEMNGLV